MLGSPGDVNVPPRVWCWWLNSHRILTQRQAERTIRMANAIQGSLGQDGRLFMPVAWLGEIPCLVTSGLTGWMYVEELFDTLPEDLQKRVIHS